MAITSEIEFGDPKIFSDTREFFKVAPDLFNRKIPSAARRVSRFARQEIQRTTPGAVSRPIQWTSEKQRRAYFATDGFGAGIPYRRTGQLMDAWRVRTDIETDGGIFELVNDSSYARYVFRPDQQVFHFNTGWRAPEDTTIWRGVVDFSSEQITRLHEAMIADYLGATK